MSGGDRGDRFADLGAFGLATAFILCILIVGVLAYSSGLEDQRRDQTPASYSQAAKEDAKRACVSAEPDAIFECVYEKVEASQDQARGEQDLTAQQRSAFASLMSAIVALFTLAISGVGVWYVKRTLDATLVAVRDTGLATKAMQDANEIAGKAADRAALTDRHAAKTRLPYVWVREATFDRAGVGPPKLKFVVENVGTMPATDVYLLIFQASTFMAEGHYHAERVASRLVHFRSDSFPKEQRHRVGALGQNAKEVVHQWHRYKEMAPNPNSVIVSGAVIYSDLEGANYVSEFYFWDGYPDILDLKPVDLKPGGLRWPTFTPYDGVELRDRPGY